MAVSVPATLVDGFRPTRLSSKAIQFNLKTIIPAAPFKAR